MGLYKLILCGYILNWYSSRERRVDVIVYNKDLFIIINYEKVNHAVPLLFIKFRSHAVLLFQFDKE